MTEWAGVGYSPTERGPEAAPVSVRAVLLDLDDTLFDHRHCAREALTGVRCLHDCFTGVDARVLEESHARILEDLHLDVLAGRMDLDAARVERFRRLYEASGVDADPDLSGRTAAAYRQRYLEARQPVKGAAEFLAALKARATVVVVSNNLLREQQDKLRHCGLAPYVDVLVVSEEVGVSKPAPRIFEVALERAGVLPDEAVMVGDSWANDVEGACAAGIRAIWFNRDGQETPDPGVPVLRSLESSPSTWRVIFGEE
jgi:putative hydrolase of the HAD superfamily